MAIHVPLGELEGAVVAFFKRHPVDLHHFAKMPVSMTATGDDVTAVRVEFIIDTPTTREFLNLGNAEIKEG
jgi:hypothetical protein